MQDFVTIIHGAIPDYIIHCANDGELKLIKTLIKDIVHISKQPTDSNNGKVGSKQNLAIPFFAAFIGLLTNFVGKVFTPEIANVIILSLLICTLTFGIYFYFDWKSKKEKELFEVISKIEARIPSSSEFEKNIHKKLIPEELLRLKEIEGNYP